MSLLGKTALALAAIALFGWYVSGVGIRNLWETVARIGPYAPLVLIPYFIVYLVDCAAWARTLPHTGLSFWTLLRIRWAGESINHLVPSAYIGGVAVKVLKLREHGVLAVEAATSAVISKTAQSVAQMIFIVIASTLLFFLSNESGVRMGVAVVVFGGTAAIVALFWAQRVGLFRIITSLVRILPFKIGLLEKRKAKLLTLDKMILSFYREQPGRFHASTFLYLGGWMLDMVEVYLVAHLLGMPISWTQALVLEAFAGVAKVLGMWIPGSLGVQESGIMIIGRLAGLPDTLSAAYALIRRGRELVFAGVGLLFLFGSRGPGRNLAAHSANR